MVKGRPFALYTLWMLPSFHATVSYCLSYPWWTFTSPRCACLPKHALPRTTRRPAFKSCPVPPDIEHIKFLLLICSTK